MKADKMMMETIADAGVNYEKIGVGRRQPDALSWPQPWHANTTVMRRPRILVAANSEAIMALRG